MTELRDASATIAMKSGGYYSARTKGAKDVIDNAAPLVLSAVEALDLGGNLGGDPSRPICLADFGAADGGTSMEMIGRAVAALRAKAPERPVVLTYTDLPSNDFSQVFRNTQGNGSAGDHLTGQDQLFVFASGTSFYRQVLPRASLNLGFSATAMHWITGTPCPIRDHVHAVGAQGRELAAFTEQGMQDWATILRHRAAELVPGGRLVLVNFCIDEEGRYLGNTGGANMFDTFNFLWQRLRDDGAITAREYQNTNFPQFYKTVEQFRAPLDDPHGPLRAAGLSLEHIETRVVPCPYKAEYLANGDLDAFAPALVGTLRSWSETVFMNGLDPTSPAARRHSVVERFYKSYEDEIRAAPEDHAMDYVHVYMTIAKDGPGARF